jgi:F0F1-type ATP synthase membrane subunit b/b'
MIFTIIKIAYVYIHLSEYAGETEMESLIEFHGLNEITIVTLFTFIISFLTIKYVFTPIQKIQEELIVKLKNKNKSLEDAKSELLSILKQSEKHDKDLNLTEPSEATKRLRNDLNTLNKDILKG